MSKINASVSFGDNAVPSPTFKMPSKRIKVDIAYKHWRMKFATTLIRKKTTKCVPRSDKLRKSVRLVDAEPKQSQATLSSNQKIAVARFSDHDSKFKYCQFKSDTIGEWSYTTVKRFCYFIGTDEYGLRCEINPNTLFNRLSRMMRKNPEIWIIKVLYLWELLNYDELLNALPFLGQQLIIEGVDKCINLGWVQNVVVSSDHVLKLPDFDGFMLTPNHRDKLDKNKFMAFPHTDLFKSWNYKQTLSFRKRFYQF